MDGERPGDRSPSEEKRFYSIVGRAEASFGEVEFDPNTGCLSFNFCVGDDFSDDVIIDLRDRPAFVEHEAEGYEIEIGPKLIRIWSGEIGVEVSDVVDGFTTEKLLFERWRGHSGITGFYQHGEASAYDLLYVGIAKVGDSFDRLMKHGHKARMTIPGNETQRKEGARVADEIYLMMFTVEPVGVTTFSFDHDNLNRRSSLNASSPTPKRPSSTCLIRLTTSRKLLRARTGSTAPAMSATATI